MLPFEDSFKGSFSAFFVLGPRFETKFDAFGPPPKRGFKVFISELRLLGFGV